MGCITWAGGYVIAVEGGKFRSVTDVEKSTAEGRIKRKFNAERLHPARTSCRITKKLTAEGRITRQEFARWLWYEGSRIKPLPKLSVLFARSAACLLSCRGNTRLHH